MTANEQYMHCGVCKHHKIAVAQDGFAFMGCNHGELKKHPVWGDFKCPLGDDKPIRPIKKEVFL